MQTQRCSPVITELLCVQCISALNVLALYDLCRELVYGDNMNRAKLRELMKASMEKEEKEEIRRKREEEGFQFDDDDFSKPSSPIKIKRS